MHSVYDFNRHVNRHGSGSYKYDDYSDSPEVMEMWVADMDFSVAQPIVEALRRRVEHGIFGYTYVGNEYYSAVTDWFSNRHSWTINPDSIIYTSGVVPAISAIIKAMTAPKMKVITQTPAYNCFFSSIRNNGCTLISNPLVYDQSTGSYTIDFPLLEQQAAAPDAKILLLCNPHNPSGRVWTPDELSRIIDICTRHGLFLLSDEIHCELVYPPHRYTPVASLIPSGSPLRWAVCVSPSKAFNIAGLQIANIVCSDPETLSQINRAININEVCDVNPFGPIATIAAYRDSASWLEALIEYLHGNYNRISEIFRDEIPELTLTPLEATYLAWLNITPCGMTSGQLADLLLEDAKVRVNPGTLYGFPEGEGFIRLNLAMPRDRIVEAALRIVRTLKTRLM